jgi:pyruvate dehydrogenase E1 component alpha subunit
VCENNLYSSHLSLLERRAADNIVSAAAAHGMVGVCLDGNDAEEVYRATVEAVNRARAGAGPTFLECRTYRWRGHVGSSWDLDVGVKRKDELKEWLDKDPVARARERLISRGTRADDLDRLEGDARTEVVRAEEFARQSPYPGDDELSLHVFYQGEESR